MQYLYMISWMLLFQTLNTLLYTSDAKLLLKLDILKNSAEKLKEFTGDFKISSNVLDPVRQCFCNC